MHDRTTNQAAAQVQDRGRDSYGLLVIALLTWVLTNMDQALFGYAVPDLMRAFGLTIGQIGMLISISFIAGTIVSAAGGVLTDMIGIRWTLPLCLGLSALLVGAQGLATDGTAFMAMRVGSFALSTALSPICAVLVANSFGPARRSIMIAILQCGYPTGWFLASFAIVPFIGEYGWRGPFMAGFAVTVVAVGIFLAMRRLPAMEPAKADHGERGGSRPLVRLLRHYRRLAISVAGVFFLYGGAIAGSVYYLPTFYREVRGYDAATAAQIVGISYVISIVGYLGSAIVGQALLGRRRATMVWMAMAIVTFSMMIWIPRGFVQDIVFFALTGIFFFGTASIFQVYFLELFPEDIRATAAGFCAAGLCLGSIVFPMVTSSLKVSLGWPLALTMTVAPLLALGICVLLTLPDDRKTFPPAP